MRVYCGTTSHRPTRWVPCSWTLPPGVEIKTNGYTTAPAQSIDATNPLEEWTLKDLREISADRGIHMVRLIFLTLLVLNSSVAYAEWVKVSDRDEAGKTVYVDPATIRRNSNLVKIWQFFDYKTVQTVGGTRFLSNKEEWEFDCVEGRSRSLGLKEYSGNMGSGTVVYTNSQVGKWLPVVPGSIGHIVWNVACQKN